MAKPRVFISSTFYDLKYVRADLERFIKELGYEPIRNETGSIAYGKDDAPESYAYKELDLCDIIISIIGGRYGSESKQEKGYSISQVELRRALERGIQVFIFIERSIQAEYSTYRLNKENDDIQYGFVDDVRVYEFIESLYQLPKNNPISTFETSSDIIEYLRAQWAGLFQRFLREQQRASEMKVLDEMKSVANTLGQLVDFLTEERKNKDDAIHHILLANHPAFRRFAEVTQTPYRVFFTDYHEMSVWLKTRRWSPLQGESYLWKSENLDSLMSISSNLFDDDDKLKVFTEEEWDDAWVYTYDIPRPTPDDTFAPDDDLPF